MYPFSPNHRRACATPALETPSVENSPGPIVEKTAKPPAESMEPRDAFLRNPRGPRPKKRTQIVERMRSDYANGFDVLRSEKEDTLANKYSASRDTVRKAREEVLKERLQQNCDK
jgi:hypothetical protein